MPSNNLNLNIPCEENVEYHLVQIFEKLESLRQLDLHTLGFKHEVAVKVEVRTLEFWRSVTAECLASFIYVFVLCGAIGGANDGTPRSTMLVSALAAGFCMAALTQCFGHISGAHINPAVSVAMGVTKKISPFRTLMFIIAQCGGGVAGAAFLYGISTTNHFGNHLSSSMAHTPLLPASEIFSVEMVLTFVVVFTYFVSMDTYRKWVGTTALTIGSAYSACSLVSMSYMNPARSLGPAFVLHRWERHWVHWLAPLTGGILAGLIYEYIFNPNRMKRTKETNDTESSMSSDEDNYDDLEKSTVPKFHGSTYNTYRSANGVTNAQSGGYCPSVATGSLYSAPATKLERVESLYGGTKSLYCKSPPLTRANLNRSQSVYTKSNTAINRAVIPKAGPLVPAQSLYPMRLNQQNHLQNQNVQNQIQQRSESIYGIRGGTNSTNTSTTRSDNEYYPTSDRVYYQRTQTNPPAQPPSQPQGNDPGVVAKFDDQPPHPKPNRPESMYGTLGSSGSSTAPSNRRVPSTHMYC